MFESYNCSFGSSDCDESSYSDIVLPSSFIRLVGSLVVTMGVTHFSGKVKSMNSVFDSEAIMASFCKGLYISTARDEDDILLELCIESERVFPRFYRGGK